MTSKDTFPKFFTEIDASTRHDHWFLSEEDVCFFIGEFTAKKGYQHSVTNQLIFNFKKPMNRQAYREWKYQ